MDWVHCNNCFQLPDREKCFYLTSCGHIFCRDCEGTCARSVCKLCGNQCTSIPLSASMKPEVQVYFTDPDELLKTKLKEVQKISMFQRNHRARLMTYYRKELNKYRQMKDAFKKILKNLKDLESERKQLSKENDAYKKLIELSGLSRNLLTPGSCGGNTPGSLGNKMGNAISPGISTPAPVNLNPMFSQFFSKLENSGSRASPTSGRVSVFSAPVNGKIGGIPRSSSPSPSTGLRNLKLSSSDSHHLPQQKQIAKEKFPTPTCSQESSDYYNIASQSQLASQSQQSVTSSPIESWKNPNNLMYQSKKDPRRVVVHPYSPDE